MNIRIPFITLLTVLLVSGCSSTTVKTTEFTPVVRGQAPDSEELLLDIGINIFDPGLDGLSRDEEERINPELRIAESRYAPWLLAETLQNTGNWGVVRVLPNESTISDLTVDGELLKSNGESMAIRVTVTDATGNEWYTREYDEAVSQFTYEAGQRRGYDPFQVIYNNIANDLLAYRKRNLTAENTALIRQTAELRFAAAFAPEPFARYLSEDRNGIVRIERLPADNDPLLVRIRDIRERDNLFVDTVQDYYATYARQMREPYDAWRSQSYHETLAVQELEASARRRFIAGTAAIIGGIAAATSGNPTARTGSLVGVGAGGYLVKSGFDQRAEAEIHLESLRELGESFESEVAPRTIELDDRTITLTGTVEEQYEQWREILGEIYEAETGSVR